MSNINRVDKQPAYLLHRFPYSETSFIGYFFTRDHGVVHLMMKGARKNKRVSPLLQPSFRVELSWSGKTDLKTLCDINCLEVRPIDDKKSLVVLLYVCELMTKLLKPYDSHVTLFDEYALFMSRHSETPSESLETSLRKFEYTLFAEIGYGLSFTKDYQSKQEIFENFHYLHDPSKGFRQIHQTRGANVYPGWVLVAMRKGNFTHPQVLRSAKTLSRNVLFHLLEGKPLISRELLGQPQKVASV